MGLVVRAYNVLFGDCLLVSWDEDDGPHHAWIDFGNLRDDANAAFEAVYRDVARITRKLDLVVITHRHLDHLEGFHALRRRFAAEFRIERLWHAFVTPQTDHVFQLAGTALRELLPAAVQAGAGEIGRIWRNNFGASGSGTKERMDEVRSELGVPASRTFAIHRGVDLAASKALPPGLKRLRIEILAPERDSGVYLRPLEHALRARGLRVDGAARGAGRRARDGRRDDPFAGGVRFDRSPLRELADFARLRRQLRSGGLELLAAVDTTRNNTSIAMRWTYAGTRLLFTGDAEEKSWEIMRRNGAPLAAHFVKVAHHGSINASPDWSYARVLPNRLAANAAVVSTDPSRFTGENDVPKREVLAGWRGRLVEGSRLFRTDSKPVGKPVIVRFQGPSGVRSGRRSGRRTRRGA